MVGGVRHTAMAKKLCPSSCDVLSVDHQACMHFCCCCCCCCIVVLLPAATSTPGVTAHLSVLGVFLGTLHPRSATVEGASASRHSWCSPNVARVCVCVCVNFLLSFLTHTVTDQSALPSHVHCVLSCLIIGTSPFTARCQRCEYVRITVVLDLLAAAKGVQTYLLGQIPSASDRCQTDTESICFRPIPSAQGYR